MSEENQVNEPLQKKKLSAMDILAMAKGIKEKKAKSGAKFVEATFIPDGTHKVRIFTDPNGELYRTVVTNGYFGKGIQAPSTCEDLPENFNGDEFERLKEELRDYGVYKYGDKYNFLIYMQVLETDKPDDTWKPGAVLVAVCKRRVETGITDMIVNLAEESADVLENMINPMVKGNPITITQVSGMNGSFSCTPSFRAADPVPLTPDNYQPLSHAYIRDGWNAEKFNNLVKAMKEARDEAIEWRRQRGLPCWGDKDWDEYQAEQEAAAEQEAESQPEQPTEEPASTQPETSQANDQMPPPRDRMGDLR